MEMKTNLDVLLKNSEDLMYAMMECKNCMKDASPFTRELINDALHYMMMNDNACCVFEAIQIYGWLTVLESMNANSILEEYDVLKNGVFAEYLMREIGTESRADHKMGCDNDMPF